MKDDAAKQRKFNRLLAYRAAYATELRKRLDTMETCWQRFLATGTAGGSSHTLHLHAHSLAGSAGTFGYRRLGQSAKQLEEIIAPLAQQALPPSALQKQQIVTLLAQLRQLSQAEQGEDENGIAELGAAAALTETTSTADCYVENRRIGIIADDPALAEQLVTQLQMYGWEPTIHSGVAPTTAQLPTYAPAAIVVDVITPDGPFAGAEFIQHLQAEADRPFPHIVISTRWDWEARLAAARAGAAAYFVKPVDFAAIDTCLERLVQHHTVPPYRILILDDDTALADHYARALAAAGMISHAIADPTRVLDALSEMQPELMLIDLYMPNYSGIEVARIIRQDPQFVSMPIVFLSTESGLAQQQQAMRTGADDFLQKPIADPDLVLAVSVRAERFRALTTLIRRDGMTGLLNHIAFKLRLEAELERSRRSGAPLSLSIVDLDYFKQINDTHGHPVGDRVIKSMAQLLRYRLRKSDLAGRYGGEEFVILFPETPCSVACTILEDLRTQFAQLRFLAPEASFCCTFSAGVVSHPPFCDMTALIRAADQALYQAKHDGRNRVVVGGTE